MFIAMEIKELKKVTLMAFENPSNYDGDDVPEKKY